MENENKNEDVNNEEIVSSGTLTVIEVNLINKAIFIYTLCTALFIFSVSFFYVQQKFVDMAEQRNIDVSNIISIDGYFSEQFDGVFSILKGVNTESYLDEKSKSEKYLYSKEILDERKKLKEGRELFYCANKIFDKNIITKEIVDCDKYKDVLKEIAEDEIASKDGYKTMVKNAELKVISPTQAYNLDLNQFIRYKCNDIRGRVIFMSFAKNVKNREYMQAVDNIFEYRLADEFPDIQSCKVNY
jgi:hypothetical protein